MCSTLLTDMALKWKVNLSHSLTLLLPVIIILHSHIPTHTYTCTLYHTHDPLGACEASLACTTCHVYVNDEHFNILSEATEE